MKTLKTLKTILGVLVFCLLLFSCKTKTLIQEVPIEVPQIHTEYVEKFDSIYVHDSIFLVIETKNDTVYNTKKIFLYKYKEKIDTITITDTITKPVYLTKTQVQTVEVIPWKMILFCGCLLVFIFLIFKLRKL